MRVACSSACSRGVVEPVSFRSVTERCRFLWFISTLGASLLESCHVNAHACVIRCIVSRQSVRGTWNASHERGRKPLLSDRRQKVLQALIEEYIANAQPVGSRTLVDRYRLGVSSATVRNELSVLEDEGYLTSPHTSAGRVPTDAGYRAFVDDLLSREYGEDATGGMFDDVRDAAKKMDDLMEQTSAALSRLTDCLSVVVAPSLLASSVKQISLVSMSSRRMLMVVVTDDGQVFNRSVEFAEDVSADELADVQNALNAALSGRSISEVRKAKGVRIEALSSPLARIVIDELVVCMAKADEGRAHSLGMSALLSKPEFSNSSAALPVLQVLEDDTVLMHLFDDVGSAGNAPDSLEVRIGKENSASELSGVSVVAAQYGSGEAQGVVAVIGPTRMDYSKVISVVRSAKSALKDL